VAPSDFDLAAHPIIGPTFTEILDRDEARPRGQSAEFRPDPLASAPFVQTKGNANDDRGMIERDAVKIERMMMMEAGFSAEGTQLDCGGWRKQGLYLNDHSEAGPSGD
jgi:hypothetical protein